MRFGPLHPDEAVGAIVAHRIDVDGVRAKKGQMLDRETASALSAAGVTEVIAARLDPDDVHEDEAAETTARFVSGAGIHVEAPFTGRTNLYAATAGLLRVTVQGVDIINQIDPALTMATLPDYAPVEDGRMVATVKIIPFAVPRNIVDRAMATVPAPLVSVVPFKSRRIGLVATRLPSLKTSTMDKTRRSLDGRLRPSGSNVDCESRVEHATPAVAAAIREQIAGGIDLLVLFGASAITDIRDVLPSAILAAGGKIVHFGMPVDPGNLLLIGDIDGMPVIGAPGCARSPVENGFDWILNRYLAGLSVTGEEISAMGVGGLLMENVSRPQPREQLPPARSVAGIILAAGRGRRMGGPNKLLAEFQGQAMIRRVVEAATASGVNPVIVVTGYRPHDIEKALDGLDIELRHNPNYAQGLSQSIRCALSDLPDSVAGALVILGDMPALSSQDIDALLNAFDHDAGHAIVLPTANGKRGNPVLWGRGYFPNLRSLSGDTGARHLLGRNQENIVEVEIGEAAALDIDTPEAVAAFREKLRK